MLVLLRLVIIMSLAGYTLPAASAAMHGLSVGPEHVHSDTHDHDMTSGEHAHEDKKLSSNEMPEAAQQKCCSDFCVGFAIMMPADTVSEPVISAIRQFADDDQAYLERSPFHRPPNI
ncbi:hypothetical protein ATN84_20255 [Paramesorhizobium deserti]|uniref:Cobalt transporter n=2 Tax=Paramesorhizobium deserti TaxID=1494590 RepID=A0A135HPV6_9HYPH|nr:hypothetical protein ATN84_20255 [Paramesorhizobium deserti]